MSVRRSVQLKVGLRKLTRSEPAVVSERIGTYRMARRTSPVAPKKYHNSCSSSMKLVAKNDPR